MACHDGDVKLAQQLITNGANVNWRNPLQVSNMQPLQEVIHNYINTASDPVIHYTGTQL